MDKVYVVVTTYNRKELLLECLNAILSQTYPVEKIILIDNASTDGTEDLLKSKGFLSNSKIQYEKQDVNLGGAGGFYKGMEIAINEECDWVWIMDDDTIPTTECLYSLIEAKEFILNAPINQTIETRSIAFLSSAVYGPNGEFTNLPQINTSVAPNGFNYWYQHLENGIVGIEMTTFVSVLVSKAAMAKCGLPCKEFFIWGDDSEYTYRLSKYFGEGYFVGKSKAIHKRIIAKPLDMNNETEINRIKMYHFLYRNRYIMDCYYHGYSMGKRSFIKFAFSKRYLRKLKFGKEKYYAQVHGMWEGIKEYPKFKNLIDQQLEKTN